MPLTPSEVNRLLLKIVLINLALYVLVLQLYKFGILYGDSVYPPLVLFLCFSISIGNLLIVGLGEKIDVSNIQSEWVKKIGVTPIMVIVAVLMSVLAGFSPLASLIVPTGKDLFMLARVGISCNAFNEVADRPRATKLLVFIWSQDDEYIQEVDDFLEGKPNSYLGRFASFMSQQVGWKMAKPFAEIDVVNKNDPRDNSSDLLRQFAKSPQLGSGGLSDQLAHKSQWTAYTHNVNAPDDYTFIPVPTLYNHHHITRLFLILPDEPPKVNDPGVASINAAVGSSLGANQEKLSPSGSNLSSLFKVEIVSRPPQGVSGYTDMDVELYYNDAKHICWKFAGK